MTSISLPNTRTTMPPDDADGAWAPAPKDPRALRAADLERDAQAAKRELADIRTRSRRLRELIAALEEAQEALGVRTQEERKEDASEAQN